MHFPAPRFTKAAALALAIGAGCGDLADQDSKPPVLATFEGALRVSAAMGVPNGNVRLALIWSVPDREGPLPACLRPASDEELAAEGHLLLGNESRLLLGSVQQAVAITPHFPSAFKLDVTSPPPPEAMYEDDDGTLKAEGKLVVYRDGNDNGKLDARTDTDASPDEVLNAGLHSLALFGEDPRTNTRPWDYGVWYLDRPRKYTEKLDLHSGFNLISYREYGAQPASEVDLELFATPALQALLCTNECALGENVPFECPEDPADLPQRPASAIAGYRPSGKGWAWTDGPDSFVVEGMSCTQYKGQHTLTWNRVYANGCRNRRSDWCMYGPTSTPSPSWPCESYVDLWSGAP